MAYFAGIAIGRFLSGLIAGRTGVWRIVVGGQFLLAAGIVVLAFGTGMVWPALGLLLIGLGNGPMFPNFCFLTPVIFGPRRSAAVMGSQFAVASLTGMTAPVLCGLLGQYVGMWMFPLFLLVFFVGMAVIITVASKTFFRETGYK